MNPNRRRSRSRRAKRDTATTSVSPLVTTTYRKRKANNDHHELQESTNNQCRDEEEINVTRPAKRARKDVAAGNVNDKKLSPLSLREEAAGNIRLEEHLKSLSIAEAKVKGKIDLTSVQPTHCVRVGGHSSALQGYEVIILQSNDTSAADDDAVVEAAETNMTGNGERDSDQCKKNDQLVLVQLIKNARGKEMKYLAVKEIRMSDLEACCGAGSTATSPAVDDGT